MYDLNLAKGNHCLKEGIKLVGAIRRLVGPNAGITGELQDMDRELREAASECQRVLEAIGADGNRPLLT